MSNCLRRKVPKRAQKHNVSNRLNLITDKKEPSNIVVGKKITDTFLKTKFSV